METRSTTMTVADYCNAVERGEIVVNRHYQRSDKIWPADARSFLIETILLGFPLPKISLNSKTDLKTRNPYKEIVDGQQRTVAITDFFRDELVLSQSIDTEEFKGLTYSELEEEVQQIFIDYPLSVDLFVGATEKEVRETFRRMNSYTIPLNPEEQRHAVYQGKFKWSVYGLARKYEDIFAFFGTFTEKAFIRMADIKMLTEIIHAYVYGVTTTNNKSLNALYKNFDKQYQNRKIIEEQLGRAIEEIAGLEVLQGGPLKKAIYDILNHIGHVASSVQHRESA